MNHDCAGSIYDTACIDCCVRLIRSCRSAKAPRIARKQQEAMLALIERRHGLEAREATIQRLKAGT